MNGLRLPLALRLGLPLLFLASISVYLWREHQRVGRMGLPLDDSWIHLTFARNLAQGHGFSYNPGERCSGSTAPLWTGVVAGLYRGLMSAHESFAAWGKKLAADPDFVDEALIEIVVAVKVVGVLLCIHALYLTWRLGLRLTGDRLAAGIAAVLLATLHPVLWGSLSGLETSLALWLTLVGLLLHVRAGPVIFSPSALGATVAFALAGMCRPEAFLLLPLALLDRLLLLRRPGRLGVGFWLAAAAHLLLFAALLYPYVRLNWLSHGKPFPTTFYAKVQGEGLFRNLDGIVASIRNGALDSIPEHLLALLRSFFVWPYEMLREWFVELGYNTNAFAIPFVGFGLVQLLRRRLPTGSRSALVPSLFLLYPMLMGVFLGERKNIHLGQHLRYVTNLMPVFAIGAGVGLGALLRLVWVRTGRAQWSEKARGIAAALVALPVAVQAAIAVNGYSWAYARNVKNINDMQVYLGHRVERELPKEAVIAMNDIGAVPYLSRRRIIDLEGIATPAILPYKGSPNGLMQFLAERKPHYLMIFPTWYPGLYKAFEQLSRYSHVIEENQTCGYHVMMVMHTPWTPENWP